MTTRPLFVGALAVGAFAATSAHAAPAADVAALRSELAKAKALIEAQQHRLDAQEARLHALEMKLDNSVAYSAAQPGAPNPTTGANTPPAPAVLAAQGSAASTPGEPATIQQAPVERVGQAAPGSDRPPEVAVLGSEGSVVTRRNQLTAEFGAEYARADRNQALFRGIELPETVLIGVFNISESRQDVITTSGSLRYGLTDKLELGVRVPFVHRADNLVTAPIQGSSNNDSARTTSVAAQGTGIGDVEFSARYQLVTAHGGWPYLIGNLQVVAPTGSSPFKVPRLITGEATKAATGAGFWGVSPSITAILPTDPAVLFGTLGYTRNFGRSFNTPIASVVVDHVKPGDAISFSGGIGISLNQRTSINLGYAHSWAFGTKTRTHLLVPSNNPELNGEMKQTSRDLQLGRFLFGMTYRVSDRASVNWSVEVGATQDATDLRTVLRIPFIVFAGG